MGTEEESDGEDEITSLCRKVANAGDYDTKFVEASKIEAHVLTFALKLRSARNSKEKADATVLHCNTFIEEKERRQQTNCICGNNNNKNKEKGVEKETKSTTAQKKPIARSSRQSTHPTRISRQGTRRRTARRVSAA